MQTMSVHRQTAIRKSIEALTQKSQQLTPKTDLMQ